MSYFSPLSDLKSDTESEPEEQQELIPSLPYDVALNCLARVPRCHHRALSQVSKPIRSLLSSPLFYSAHSTLHGTQPFLYVFLSHSSSKQWLALFLNPNDPTLPLEVLPPIPSPTFRPSGPYALLGHDIYVIGSHHRNIPSPQVWVLDCRFNRWREGPRMLVPRQHAVVAVLVGKIYVMGGCGCGYGYGDGCSCRSWSGVWGEVLDPAVGSCPVIGWYLRPHRCGALRGRVYVMRAYYGGWWAYDPRSGVWKEVVGPRWWGREERQCWVDGVMYSYGLSRLEGLEVIELREEGNWNLKEVQGSNDLVHWCLGAAMAGAAGKLFLVWIGRRKVKSKFEILPSADKHCDIWCSQIEVIKNSEDGEVGAALCWSKNIHSFDEEYGVRRCFAVVI